jgi:hypothetical protein
MLTMLGVGVGVGVGGTVAVAVGVAVAVAVAVGVGEGVGVGETAAIKVRTPLQSKSKVPNNLDGPEPGAIRSKYKVMAGAASFDGFQV